MEAQFGEDEGAVLAAWVEALNDRDLDGILAHTAPDACVYPLALGGVRSSYRGHDGVREWFRDLHEAEHRHRITLLELRVARPGEVLGTGEVRFSADGEPFPFWTRDLVRDGRIARAHHYLTDPAIAISLPPLA